MLGGRGEGGGGGGAGRPDPHRPSSYDPVMTGLDAVEVPWLSP